MVNSHAKLLDAMAAAQNHVSLPIKQFAVWASIIGPLLASKEMTLLEIFDWARHKITDLVLQTLH